jgi:hypothetical protein
VGVALCGVRQRGALVCCSKALSILGIQRASISPKGGEMRIRARYWGLGAFLALAAALMLLAALPSSAANHGKGHGKQTAKHSAAHVRWDIISLVGGNPPGPLNAVDTHLPQPRTAAARSRSPGPARSSRRSRRSSLPAR